MKCYPEENKKIRPTCDRLNRQGLAMWKSKPEEHDTIQPICDRLHRQGLESWKSNPEELGKLFRSSMRSYTEGQVLGAKGATPPKRGRGLQIENEEGTMPPFRGRKSGNGASYPEEHETIQQICDRLNRQGLGRCKSNPEEHETIQPICVRVNRQWLARRESNPEEHEMIQPIE